jgi:hypothetical protein
MIELYTFQRFTTVWWRERSKSDAVGRPLLSFRFDRGLLHSPVVDSASTTRWLHRARGADFRVIPISNGFLTIERLSKAEGFENCHLFGSEEC